MKYCDNVNDTQNSYDISFKLAFLRINNEINVDYPNKRYLLCKAMQGFATNCESKTRILVPNFLRFIK
jgi:hypothetical protein